MSTRQALSLTGQQLTGEQLIVVLNKLFNDVQRVRAGRTVRNRIVYVTYEEVLDTTPRTAA